MFKNPISSIHDSDSFNFTDTIDIMKSLKGGAETQPVPVGAPIVGAPVTSKSNNITVIIVALISVLYMVVNSDSTSPEIINIVDTLPALVPLIFNYLTQTPHLHLTCLS